MAVKWAAGTFRVVRRLAKSVALSSSLSATILPSRRGGGSGAMP
jgi:hypothetical protein